MTATKTRTNSPDKKSGKAVAGEIRPVAKSLHTISVIQNLALHLMTSNANHADPAIAVDSALHILGLNDRPDPYGLAAIALKGLKGDAK